MIVRSGVSNTGAAPWKEFWSSCVCGRNVGKGIGEGEGGRIRIDIHGGKKTLMI